MEGYSSMYNNLSWESSSSPVDIPADPFHSALTSLVSSPDFIINTATTNNNNSLMRELIGRLGTICTSPDPARDSLYCSAPNSAATSCYSTPLNSPPKLGLSLTERNSRTGGGGGRGRGLGYPVTTHLPLPADSGLVERAARFSCFSGGNVAGGRPNQGGFPGLPLPQVERVESGRFSRVSSSQNVAAGFRSGNSHENMDTGDSPEGSLISEQIKRPSDANSSRKRKSVPRGKVKDGEDCAENGQLGEKKRKEDNVNPPEPPKDYIHVRARRGQATDSHSLAERVRREKISQRMKVLQDLVPGCNKVTGKAVMLDEIINYVQSLQHQVEFLSMKLATLNPRMDFNADALVSKEMCNPHGSSLFPGDSSSSAFLYGYQMQLHDAALVNKMENQLPLNALSVAVHPSMEGFCKASSAVVLGIWDDELHGTVQMDLQQNQPQQRLQGGPAAGQMKIES
ncbi:hypothetical protein MLD38_038424 [Melastoma candidum]|uniref:Uncharacterized protein n=1 Tax=Melastoma candidum TaxID=119954 RepID=A0ACB9L014_9MYRT|nr:hypothetical protein MLD38_038424 [Melastoma candidum]